MPLAEPIQIGSVIIASPALKKTPILLVKIIIVIKMLDQYSLVVIDLQESQRLLTQMQFV
jgi:hypothetical protein